MKKRYAPSVKLLFVALLYIAWQPGGVKAQCTNADFSLGNFTGWTGTWSDGLCTSMQLGICLCNTPEPFQHAGIDQGPNNGSVMDTAHHFIMTTGYDSLVGGTTLPVVFPGGTGKSARLGNASVSETTDAEGLTDAETISRTFFVTLENSLFIYNSAIVIADGGHPSGHQAYFQVQGITGSGDTIPEAAYYVNGTTCNTIGGFAVAPGQASAPYIYYKRWSADTINLLKYVGQTITITFITSGCKPGGCGGTHFAYVYLSCGCSPAPIIPSSFYICNHYDITLTASATALSYTWTGPGIISGANTQVVTIDTAGVYFLQMVLPGSVTVHDSIAIQGGVLSTSLSQTICGGDTFNFNGRKLTNSGIYTDTLTSPNSGCDSIITLSLQANFLSGSLNKPICSVDTFNFYGRKLTTPGVYTDTLTGLVSGCDSIITLTLYSGVFSNSISSSICSGDTFNFNGRRLTASGIYTDTLVAATTGCDSIITLTLTVVTNVPAVVSITSNPAVPCNGETVTFTAVSNTVNANYSYWKNGNIVNPIDFDSTYTSSVVGGDVWQCKMTDINGCYSNTYAYSNTITIGALHPVTITSSAPGCQAKDTLMASGNFTSGESLLWYHDSLLVTNPASDSFYIPQDTGLYYVQVKNSSGCYAQSSYASVYTDTAIISIGISANPVCPNTTAVFKASPEFNVASATYQWRVNGINSGTNSPVFSSATLTNNTSVTCILITNSACGHADTATSNSVTVYTSVNVTPDVTISASPAGKLCNGVALTVTPTSGNGGPFPIYQWFVNGILTDPDDDPFTPASYTNGEVIQCRLISHASCATPDSIWSNTYTVNAPGSLAPSMTISIPETTVCSGTELGIGSVIANGGNAPAYEWMVNGSVISGETSSTFAWSFYQADTIICRLAVSTCASPDTVLSNPIIVTTYPNSPPTISITSLPPSPICQNKAVTFSATVTNGGTSPGYQWFVNNQSVQINGSSYSTSTLQNGDSIKCLVENDQCPVQFNYTVYSNSITYAVNPVMRTTVNKSVCSGTPFFFNGNLLLNSGTYYDTLVSSRTGCDSITVLNLTILPEPTGYVYQTICSGDTFFYNGSIFTVAGIYEYVFQTSSDGCDSIITLRIAVWDIDTTILYQSVCVGQSFDFYGNLLDSAGTYYKTLSSVVTGCDSVIALILSVNHALSTSISRSICAGNDYNFNGRMLTTTGSYNDTLPSSVSGCDSIVTLVLTVNPVILKSIVQSVCAGHSYNFNGTQLSSTGTYHDTLTSTVTGCDSIVTLTLTVNPVITTPVNQSVCAGHSYNFNGTQISSAGTYRDTLASSFTGCDSVVVLTLSVGSVVTSNTSQSICAGSSYSFNGVTLTAPGTYNDTLPSSVSGCDSVVRLTLAVIPADTSLLYRSICTGGSFNFNGILLSAEGVYSDTLTSLTTGCDSIVTLYLTVTPYPVITAPVDTMLCAGSPVILSASAGVSVITWAGGYTNGQKDTINQSTVFVVYADTFGCIASDTFTVTVLPEKVWPGDANEDLIVNNYDILAIGIAYGSTGPVRPNASLTWQEQCAPAWADSFINGANYAFADCNGDGIINYTDTGAVSLNYSLTHPRSDNQRTGSLPLIVQTNAGIYHVGETVTGQVLLGTGTIPANNVYGIAFTLDAGPFARPNTLKLSQTNSWMLSGGNEIMFGRSTGATTMDAAQTRISHTNISNYGVIADFSFVVDSGISNGSMAIITISAPLCLNNAGDTIYLDNIADTLTLLVNGINTIPGSDIAVYPNPTTGAVVIAFSGSVPVTTVAEVYDQLGQVVLAETLNRSTNMIDLSTFAAGFYFIKISSDNVLITTRKICLTK